MGGIPIISEALDIALAAVQSTISIAGYVWTNSPALLKTFIFCSAIVGLTGILALFFDTPLALPKELGGAVFKPTLGHRLFLNDTCMEAYSLQTKKLTWSGQCKELATCLNNNGGDMPVSDWFSPYINWGVIPRCSCSCIEIPSAYPNYPILNVSDLQCVSSNCFGNYTGYATNATLSLYDYCIGQTIPTSQDIYNLSKTTEACKTAGFDYLDWKSLLTLEVIVLLTQFALALRASRAR